MIFLCCFFVFQTHRMKRRVVEDQHLAHLLWVKRESQHQDLQISSLKGYSRSTNIVVEQ